MAKKRKMARGTAQKGGMPPKHTQFRKGTSGNPRGRPKGSKNLSTYLMEAARDQVTATVGGRTRTISKLQATTMQLATKAADEIETRAASVKPSQFPIGAPDIEVIRAVYGRMKQCDPKKNVRNKMAPTPANMYADVLRHDLCAFIHRSFLELNAREEFLFNWHIERLAAKLEEVRRGSCKRLIVNLPPRHLKSHVISIVFPAWLLGHDPGKQILSVTYAQDFSDNLARKSRTLMTSPFYEGLFDTRLSKGREAVSDFETTEGGTRFNLRGRCPDGPGSGHYYNRRPIKGGRRPV